MIEQLIQSDNKKKSKSFLEYTKTDVFCDIRFAPSVEHDQNKIDEFKHKMQNTYTDEKCGPVKYNRATLGENGLSVKEEIVQRTNLRHKERNHLLQIFPGLLRVSEMGQFPAWDIFKNDLSMAYSALSEALSISGNARIGLRYVNLIPRQDRQEALFQWLNPNKYYPDGILSNAAGFQSKCEFNLQNNHKLIVSLSESLQPNSLGSIIFDIDVISFDLPSTDCEYLMNILDQLHEIASQVFQSSISEKYQSLLMEV